MKYNIYIPTKGRYKKTLTADLLTLQKIPFKLVVENNEYDLYAKRFKKNQLLRLPESDYGTVAVARNFIKKYSIKNGEKKHWQIDDDIKKIIYYSKGVQSEDIEYILTNVENFTDKYNNIALSGLSTSIFVKFAKKPFEVNKLVYTVKLINNEPDIWWEKGVIDDMDYNLQALSNDYCTLRFNAFCFNWSSAGKQEGGFTEIYLDEKFYDRVKRTQEKWNLGKITEKIKGGNKLYTIDYKKRFNSYKQRPEKNES